MSGRVARRGSQSGHRRRPALPPEEQALRRAFEEFELDHRNPWHWRLLLLYLTNAGWPNGRGANWGPDDDHMLVTRADQFDGSESEKIREVRKDYPEDYRHITDGHLRDLLREARGRMRI